MPKSIKVLLLAYADNPVGSMFINAFLRDSVPLSGVLVETKSARSNWKRIRSKIRKDGVKHALFRIFEVFLLKLFRRNVVGIARRNGIPVFRVDRFNSPECASLIGSLDVDILAIASAPILKEAVFTKARIGCLNAHPGWLPKYRGIGANRAAILDGEMPGICIHFVDAGIDTGRLILRERLALKPGDTIARINDRASARGAELMAQVIHQIENGQLRLLDVNEPPGECYRPGKYGEIRTVNRMIRRMVRSQEHLKNEI